MIGGDTGVGVSSRRVWPLGWAWPHQQLAQLHEVKHVALVHPGQLLPQLDGLFPHLRRSGTGMGTGTGLGTASDGPSGTSADRGRPRVLTLPWSR